MNGLTRGFSRWLTQKVAGPFPDKNVVIASLERELKVTLQKANDEPSAEKYYRAQAAEMEKWIYWLRYFV